MYRKRCLELLIAATLLGMLKLGVAAADAPQTDCHVGSYRFANGPDVDVANSGNGKLRWRREDGTSGQLTRTDRPANHGTGGVGFVSPASFSNGL